MPRTPGTARLWLVLRMIISTTLAYALATAFRLPQGYWAVLTAVIVTQNSVGGSLKAAIDRFVGSILGALVGALAAVLLPAHTPTVVGLILVGAVAPLVLLTAYAPHYRIAPVSAALSWCRGNRCSRWRGYEPGCRRSAPSKHRCCLRIPYQCD